MYGSSFCIDTRKPQRSRIQPIAAEVRPLPREDTTPPVTKMYLVIAGFSGPGSQALQESIVVRSRLDAPGVAPGVEHADVDVVLEEAQLLEALRLGEAAARQRRDRQQRLAVETVHADVAQQREAALLHVRDRRTAEVERPAVAAAHDLDDVRILERARLAQRRGERVAAQAAFEQLGDERLEILRRD